MSVFQEKVRVRKLSNFFGVTEDEIKNEMDERTECAVRNNSSLSDEESSNCDEKDDRTECIVHNKSTLSDEESSNYSELYNYYDGKVLYDSWDEYENLREDFREKIPKIIGLIETRKCIFLSNECETGITSVSPIEDDLKIALGELIKQKNSFWITEITRIIINALQGIESAICVLNGDTNSTIDLIDQENLYTELATGVITNIIMETKDNMGECELNKLAIFKCSECEKITTYLFNEGEQQDMCGRCWSENV